MTTAMDNTTTPEDQPDTPGQPRGPRLNKHHIGSARLTALAQQFAELRRIYGPPECAVQRTTFERAERAVEIVTARRADPETAEVTIDGQTLPATEPITTVQTWCHSCVFKDLCLELMTSSPPSYTGIAGGQILHKSRPYPGPDSDNEAGDAHDEDGDHQ